MNIGLLIEKKKYFTNKINETNNKIFNINHELDSLKKVNSINNDKLNQDILLHQIAIIEKRQKTNNRMLPMFMKEKNKYIVEIHKKFSVPFACIVFVFAALFSLVIIYYENVSFRIFKRLLKEPNVIVVLYSECVMSLLIVVNLITLSRQSWE